MKKKTFESIFTLMNLNITGVSFHWINTHKDIKAGQAFT